MNRTCLNQNENLQSTKKLANRFSFARNFSFILKTGFVLAGIFCLSLLQTYSQGVIGKSVNSVKLIDPNDAPKDIPDVGTKVVMVFYTDPDVKDVNDPLSDAVKAKNFPKTKYTGIGIANCSDTWLPNAAIRMKARQKEKQFPGTLILLDEDLVLQKAWGLSTCDEMGVVVIVGKDKKIKYVKYIKTQAESKAAIPEALKILTDEIAK